MASKLSKYYYMVFRLLTTVPGYIKPDENFIEKESGEPFAGNDGPMQQSRATLPRVSKQMSGPIRIQTIEEVDIRHSLGIQIHAVYKGKILLPFHTLHLLVLALCSI